MIVKKEARVRSTTSYIPANFYMLRAPALSTNTFQQLSDIRAEAASLEDLDSVFMTRRAATQQQILAMSANSQIDQAIAIASSSLHKGILQLRDNGTSPNKRAQKVYSRLLRYLIRMSTRPTPFGLFSGVGLGYFGEKTHIHLGTPAIAHFRVRPDMNWLQVVLKSLEASPDLMTQLCLHTNQMAYIAGDRVYLPHTGSYSQRKSQAVSLRATSVVCTALEFAEAPLPYIVLRNALLQAFPAATTEQVDKLLWQLWEHGLLISTLHPPLTTSQPAHYLHQQLEMLQGAEKIRDILGVVLEKSSALNTTGIDDRLGVLNTLVQLQNTVAKDEKQQPSIQVDSLLSIHSPILHFNIGTAAAQAAELLLHLTPWPEGSSSLKDYRRLFLEKYGSNAEVPLLELLSPERGLGTPAGYITPGGYHTYPAHKKRQRILQYLVQEALNSHSLEVELNETHLTELRSWNPNLEQMPRSLEIYLQIQATSREDLDRGIFCAVVSPNPGSPSGGQSFGRFFDLLEERDRDTLQSLLTQEESLEPEALFAELSYQPSQFHNSNVAIRPGLRSYEIAIGTTISVPRERVIPLSDLVVGIHNDRFYLRSVKHHKKVIVCQLHMLNIYHAPAVCRFLIDVSFDGLPVLSGFDWGSLSSSPFLPRITVSQHPHAKLVLAPARWNLDITTIQPQGEGNAEIRWFVGLQRWRTQWRVPRFVYLSQIDQRLLLDLEHPLMAMELFGALRALTEGQQVVLQEVLPDFEHLWLTDTQGARYFCEIVVPLLRRDTFEPHEPKHVFHPASGVHPISHVVSQQDRVFYPGSAWNYVKLYCTEAQQEAIIAGPMRDLIGQFREQHLIDRWFFVTYADPKPHLRLRIHSPEGEHTQTALLQLLSWCRELATRGLIQRFLFDTYEREVARYGGPMAIDIAEQIFSIDSEICNSLIAARYNHRLTIDPMAIAVCSLDHFFSAWNYDTQRRLHWLQKRVKKYAWSKQFYSERKSYCELLTPWTENSNSELLMQRVLLHELLVPLKHLLPPLAEQVRNLDRIDQLWIEEEELLASLAHMHKVRLLGLDTNKEEQLYAFWRYTLESIQLRSLNKDESSDEYGKGG